MSKSEEATVETRLRWASNLLDNGDLLVWLNIYCLELDLINQIVSIYLNKLDVLRPDTVSNILEFPFELEDLQFSFLNLRLSWVEDALALKNWIDLFWNVYLLWWHLNFLVVILTNHRDWNASWISNLDHSILHWLKSLFTCLAKVIVSSDRALISNTDNW